MLIIQGCNVHEYSIHVCNKINTCTACRSMRQCVYRLTCCREFQYFHFLQCCSAKCGLCECTRIMEKCIYMYASVSRWDCVSAYYGYMWTRLYIKNYPRFTLHMSTCVKGIEHPCHGVSRQGSSSSFNLPLAYMSPTTYHQPRCTVVY